MMAQASTGWHGAQLRRIGLPRSMVVLRNLVRNLRARFCRLGPLQIRIYLEYR